MITFCVDHPALFFKMLVIFYFLPPCIISFTYFIEVVIYRNFMYFPYVIFLMVFPISIRVFLFTARIHCEEIEKNLSKQVLKIKFEEKDAYIWQKDTDILPENRLDSYLLELAILKEENLVTIELFELFRRKIHFFKARIFFNLFSMLCWLISICTLLYLMLDHAI